ncbi:MBL fold metallo-hydrolase [uncultured Solobacterium sp.]|uniref:MBL fold metallo-hydrolase n=1 Tax=uncultured Solobacterium sp. TaxID=747375 RepID=UPI001CB2CDF9|nr:MBL fold metallo-hydrolase [uncultured Solobacterium sp.]MBF1072411.1 MBL fold metallo-hydrolase [Solobacterium sp.]MBF1095442.1 MBL fold metallo-hydrolase [Solobacterium sp.]
MSKNDSRFQVKFMSFMFKGKEIFKPLNTGFIDDRVSCIREYVANIYFYTKDGHTIMIDAGYNYDRLAEKMQWLGINSKDIKEILVTHQDTDHVGAIEQGSDELFRDATIYIGNIENEYLEGRKHRKVFWGLTTLPQVIIDNPKILIEDGQIFYIGNIKIEAFLVPGHTWGHLVYLVDDCYLFTGDTIWLGADGGYAFLNTLAEDRRLQCKSLQRLKEILEKRNLQLKIITGHTGWTDDFTFAFAHIDEICNSLKRKPKVHDPKAPYDGFDESEDTEENARSGYLAQCYKAI